VLVASLPQHEIDGWIANQELLPLTPHTIVHPERLRIEIARVRQQGWASADQEFELGLRTVGVPLKTYRGETVAARNISVHAARMTIGPARRGQPAAVAAIAGAAAPVAVK